MASADWGYFTFLKASVLSGGQTKWIQTESVCSSWLTSVNTNVWVINSDAAEIKRLNVVFVGVLSETLTS